MEVPKRLAPTPDTLRRLFLQSGNQCAMPGCFHPIIDEDGNYVAEICHIDAALEGGERFNKEMTNEQRRSFENLMLMCHAHHVVTDNVGLYPVERMRKIKEDHERRFQVGVERLFGSVADWTKGSVITHPRSLRAFHTHCGWSADMDSTELNDHIELVMNLAESLRQTSRPTRQLLAIVVDRGRVFGVNQEYIGVLASEIEDVTGTDPSSVTTRVGQLAERGLAYLDTEDTHFWEFPGPYVAAESRDYPTWSQIRDYCRSKHIELERIVVDLRFDLLD